ncbi:MAG: hypothetical protein VYC39_15420 [Myxococcota bacterium]|nr:hypothetical protein [Myxococcota bacterium]
MVTRPDSSVEVTKKPTKKDTDPFSKFRTEAETRLKRLEGYVIRGASNPENPWALAHGILAFGPNLKASNGRLAIDVMVEDFAQLEGKGKNRSVNFPTRTPKDHPVEPHNNLMASSLLQAGVVQTKTFKLKTGEKISMKDLVERVRMEAVLPETPKQWHDFAWTYSALLHAGAKPKSESSKNLALNALNYVESQQAFLTELMRKGQPDKVVKKKQLIYAHTCGGLHMIQAALFGASLLRDPKVNARAQTQLETILFRWKAERSIYRNMKRQYPMYSLLLQAQELKFYGHLLETLSQSQRMGIYPVNDNSRAIVKGIIQDLVSTIDDLAVNYLDLESVKNVKKQVYYDLIGDGCHAIRGLRESLMAFFPRK